MRIQAWLGAMIAAGFVASAAAAPTPPTSPTDVSADFDAVQAAIDQKDFDLALALLARITAVEGVSPNDRAAAWDAKAGIYFLERQDVKAAVAALDQSLELFPDDWRRLQYRGAYRTTTGRPELAIRDLDRAVALSPDVWSTHGARGLALLSLGRFDAAARDLEHALEIEPDRPYVALALHVARVRAGKDDRATFAAAFARFGGAAWPGPIFGFYAGELTAEGLFQAVQSGPEAQHNDRLCEASYYVAQAALATGETPVAREHLQMAVDICGYSFSERGGALSELKRFP